MMLIEVTSRWDKSQLQNDAPLWSELSSLFIRGLFLDVIFVLLLSYKHDPYASGL